MIAIRDAHMGNLSEKGKKICAPFFKLEHGMSMTEAENLGLWDGRYGTQLLVLILVLIRGQ